MGETLGAPARLFVALGSVPNPGMDIAQGNGLASYSFPNPYSETRLPADTYVETRPGPFRTPSMSFTILDTDITEQVFFDTTGLRVTVREAPRDVLTGMPWHQFEAICQIGHTSPAGGDCTYAVSFLVDGDVTPGTY